MEVIVLVTLVSICFQAQDAMSNLMQMLADSQGNGDGYVYTINANDVMYISV